MEPEGSLPCSQKPSTGSYRKSYKSGPHIPNLLLYPLIYAQVYRMVSCLRVSQLFRLVINIVSQKSPTLASGLIAIPNERLDVGT
jgi:hypothetical protein